LKNTLFYVVGGKSMPSNEELDEQIQNILKQKELIEAQKALDEAKKTADAQLAQVQKTSDIVAQQKTIAENQKAIAEAQRDAILASFPKGTTTPLEGDITTSDKFGYISKLVAYESMKENAIKIADIVNGLVEKPAEKNPTPQGKADAGNAEVEPVRKKLGKEDKLLIVNDLDVASSDIPLIQVESILELFTDNIKTQIDTNEKFLQQYAVVTKVIPLAAAVLAPMIIPGIISSIADVVGYFQTNYDIKGQDFTLENQAILSVVAGKITEIPVYIYNFNLVEESEVLKSFKTTLDLKQKLDGTVDRITIEIVKRKNAEVKTIQDKIAELKKRLGELKDTEQDRKEKERILNEIDQQNKLLEAPNEVIDKANVHIANSQSLAKAFLEFADSATKGADSNTLPLLLKAALRKHIKTIGITHLLNLKILSSGGEAITMKHRFLFWMTNSSFIGGSVISYILADKNGMIIAADTVPGLARLNYQLSGQGVPNFKQIPLPVH
jgi:hypothetical protein